MTAKAWQLGCVLLLASACGENDRYADMAAGARPLSGAQARLAFSGGFEGKYKDVPFGLCLDTGGRARGRVGALQDVGNYRVTREGLLCLTWQHLGEGREVCSQYYVQRGAFLAYEYPSGERVTRGRRVHDADCD